MLQLPSQKAHCPKHKARCSLAVKSPPRLRLQESSSATSLQLIAAIISIRRLHACRLSHHVAGPILIAEVLCRLSHHFGFAFFLCVSACGLLPLPFSSATAVELPMPVARRFDGLAKPHATLEFARHALREVDSIHDHFAETMHIR